MASWNPRRQEYGQFLKSGPCAVSSRRGPGRNWYSINRRVGKLTCPQAPSCDAR